ncbi:MAG: HipA domain-containing protein [Sedimentisphaerales bacterium]|nr:HipA domain-containing protein [Sedimentisphaerales bacterium]MBN2842488.1 HipA domain-containing protein [Sedimentisphaerales bacterium]
MSKNNYTTKQLRALFGKPILPAISLSLNQIAMEAQKLAGKLSISGIQPKLSMRLENDTLQVVATDGQFILKPQTQLFEELPQNEFLCMQMGRRFGLNTAESILLELSDGTPAYLVKRFDRFKKGTHMEKLACEDMQQILGGPDKYAGSYEQIGRIIKKHCTFAPLELQRYFETIVFNFAIGNGDAHRKNFSLLTSEKGIVALSPAYDLVSSRLAIPEEDGETALTISGKKDRINKNDLMRLAHTIGVDANYAEKKIRELFELRGDLIKMITESQLSPGLQQQLTEIINQRLDRLP